MTCLKYRSERAHVFHSLLKCGPRLYYGGPESSCWEAWNLETERARAAHARKYVSALTLFLSLVLKMAAGVSKMERWQDCLLLSHLPAQSTEYQDHLHS